MHTPCLTFWHPCSKLGHNWLLHWRGTSYLWAAVYQNHHVQSAPSTKFVKHLGTKTVESTYHQCKQKTCPPLVKKESKFHLDLNGFGFICAGITSVNGNKKKKINQKTWYNVSCVLKNVLPFDHQWKSVSLLTILWWLEKQAVNWHLQSVPEYWQKDALLSNEKDQDGPCHSNVWQKKHKNYHHKCKLSSQINLHWHSKRTDTSTAVTFVDDVLPEVLDEGAVIQTGTVHDRQFALPQIKAVRKLLVQLNDTSNSSSQLHCSGYARKDNVTLPQ